MLEDKCSFNYLSLVNTKVCVMKLSSNTSDCVTGTYSAAVLEGIPGGTMVLRVTADDADIGLNADLTFSIENGDPGGLFEIRNGTLSFRAKCRA